MDNITVTLGVLLLLGYGVYRGVKWMMRAGSAHSSTNPPLSPNDLKVLEESAQRLMLDLQLVTDECVERIEKALADAQKRIDALEAGNPSTRIQMPEISPTQQVTSWPPSATPSSALELNQALSTAARESGMTTGEMELLKGLQNMSNGR